MCRCYTRRRILPLGQSDALRRVFEGVVAKCIAAGLVGREGFSIDASLIGLTPARRSAYLAISPLPGRRPRKHRAQFVSISLPLMLPVMMRRTAVMTVV